MEKNPLICFVCGKAIAKTASPVYVGTGNYRHQNCFAGSRRWINSKRGEESELRVFFVKQKEDRNISEIFLKYF